jgi:hypothetical protein
MYKFEIRGSEYKKARVKQISRTTGVIVSKDWIDSDVIIIKEGDIEKFEKIHT